MFLTEVVCGLCGKGHSKDEIQTVCRACGRPLLARYDLSAARTSGMWKAFVEMEQLGWVS